MLIQYAFFGADWLFWVYGGLVLIGALVYHKIETMAFIQKIVDWFTPPVVEPKFKEGQKIQLIRPRLAFIAGVYYTDMEVLIQPCYILKFFKETDNGYLFNVILNAPKGSKLVKDNLVYFEKSSFTFLKYREHE